MTNPKDNTESYKSEKNETNKNVKEDLTKKTLKAIATGIFSLAFLATMVNIGYEIFKRKEEPEIDKPSVYVKTLDELVGDLYYPTSVETLRGTNPYGDIINILKVTATGSRNEKVEFSIYENNPCNFENLVNYFNWLKDTKNPFGLVDPLDLKSSGYPRDSKNIINLRIERTTDNNPVYIIEGDDIIFYNKKKIY